VVLDDSAFLAKENAVLRASKSGVVTTVNIRKAAEAFAAKVGKMPSGGFGMDEVATFAGLGRSTFGGWVADGLVIPTTKGHDGRGNGARFDAVAAFASGVIGALRRAGVKPSVLRRVYRLIISASKQQAEHQETTAAEAEGVTK
jgi:hypothetical protein